MRLLKTLTGSNMHMVPAVEGHVLLLFGVISENFAMYLFSPSLHIICISTSPLPLLSLSLTLCFPRTTIKFPFGNSSLLS